MMQQAIAPSEGNYVKSLILLIYISFFYCYWDRRYRAPDATPAYVVIDGGGDMNENFDSPNVLL